MAKQQLVNSRLIQPHFKNVSVLTFASLDTKKVNPPPDGFTYKKLNFYEKTY